MLRMTCHCCFAYGKPTSYGSAPSRVTAGGTLVSGTRPRHGRDGRRPSVLVGAFGRRKISATHQTKVRSLPKPLSRQPGNGSALGYRRRVVQKAADDANNLFGIVAAEIR